MTGEGGTKIEADDGAARHRALAMTRIISFATVAGPLAFYLVMIFGKPVAHETAEPDLDDLTRNVAIGAAALAVVANNWGARVRHAEGTVAERMRAICQRHVIIVMLGEAAAFSGLILWTANHDRRFGLAAALGAAIIFGTAVRTEMILRSLR